MQMVDMKVKREKEDSDSCCVDGDNEYGYGLRLYIDNDRMKKLGLSDPLDAGQEVSIMAVGYVEGSMKSSRKDGDHVSMDIQITKLALDTGRADPADVLYNKGDRT